MSSYASGMSNLRWMLVFLVLLIPACAMNQLVDKENTTPKVTTVQVPKPIDALLVGIQPEDIAKAQAEVKRHYLVHWPVVSERSRYVRQRVLAALKQQQAPASLQVLPIVESGYNPYALSYAGATGLWQLMPRTAKGLGIDKAKSEDGRRNIATSSEAAVIYLKQLHDQFNSWPLAFASYHLGPTAVAKRLRKKPWKAEDGINAMPVPGITRAYVRHVIGLTALLHLGVIDFPEPVTTRPVILEAPVDLSELAEQSGLGQEDFFKFNPGLNQRQYLHRNVVVHVPEEHVSIIEAMKENMVPEYVHIEVRSGDTLWRLAKRHGISVNYLRTLNPELVSSHLSIGQSLRVPANQLAKATPMPNPLLASGRRILYKVRSGDSLWSIASRFGTTPRAIARSNQMRTDELIRPGDKLWVLARINPG